MAELTGDEVRDRRALEEVLGYSLDDEPWPDDAWPVGARVEVIKDTDWDGPWSQVFTGVVSAALPPKLVAHELAREGEYEYFIVFDDPQIDSEGEGPYSRAAIWGRYLNRI